jgi:hypothetical protein
LPAPTAIEKQAPEFLAAARGKVPRPAFHAADQMSHPIVRSCPIRAALLLLSKNADGIAYDFRLGLPPFSRQTPDQRLRFVIQPNAQGHKLSNV